MALCPEIIKISRDVCSFIKEAEPYEDSITDFIIWKIKRLHRYRLGIYGVNIHDTRRNEKITGADIEIVFTYNNQSIHLLIQAKRIYDRDNSNRNRNVISCSELERSTNQIDNLINYSFQYNKLPFYLFYSKVDRNIQHMCRYLCESGNIFVYAQSLCRCLILKDASIVRNIYQEICRNQNRNSILTYNLVNGGNPFLCLFCCPIVQGYNPDPLEHLLDYLKKYYGEIVEKIGEKKIIQKVPEYVTDIVDGKFQENLGNVQNIENEEGRLIKLKNILKNYGLIYEGKNEGKEETWIVKRVLVIDFGKKKNERM